MSFKAISEVMYLPIKPSSAKFVLIAYANCADDDMLAYPSAAAVAEITQLNIKTIEKTMPFLVQNGYLVDTGRRAGKTCSTIVYQIKVPPKTGDVKERSSPKNGASMLPQKRGNIRREAPPILDGSSPNFGEQAPPILENKLPQKRGRDTINETIKETIRIHNVGKVSESENSETDFFGGISANAKIPAASICPVEKIVAAYHEKCPTLGRCRILSETRKAYIRQRWREMESQGEYKGLDDGLVWWNKFFDYVHHSDFLCGRIEANGKTPFQADLEWLTRPTNFAKVFEGRYANRNGGAKNV